MKEYKSKVTFTYTRVSFTNTQILLICAIVLFIIGIVLSIITKDYITAVTNALFIFVDYLMIKQEDLYTLINNKIKDLEQENETLRNELKKELEGGEKMNTTDELMMSVMSYEHENNLTSNAGLYINNCFNTENKTITSISIGFSKDMEKTDAELLFYGFGKEICNKTEDKMVMAFIRGIIDTIGVLLNNEIFCKKERR